MNVALLTNAIVQQTMVLIAQLATASGLRAPLSGIANQVFLDLVRELEGQGVSRKVVADMFGLALRSYQQKVQRLTESATRQGQTLWGAVFEYIQEQKVVSRTLLFERFEHEDGHSLRGIVNDLVGSGLVYRTGRGPATVYRVASRQEVGRALGAQDEAQLAAHVWVTVHALGTCERAELVARLPLPAEDLDRALELLIEDGRVSEQVHGDTTQYQADACLIPVGETVGWGAALLDHYHAVVGAMCAKLRLLEEEGPAPANIGGSTYSFDVWQGHPHAERVTRLLEKTRAELSVLWDEVRAVNSRVDKPAQYERVTFYFGQNVGTEDRD